MKEKLNNIKLIIRDNSKIIVPAIVITIILIVTFITLYFYKYNSYHKEEKLVLYNYVTVDKNEFDCTMSTNRKKEIIKLEVDKNTIVDSFPMYNRDKKIVIFPKSMSVVYAANEFYQYSTNDNSYIYYDVNNYKLIDKDYNDSVRHSFLYDGNNLYFFLDKVKLKIGDKTVELSPLSMVIANLNNNVLYYDYESDTANLVKYAKQDVIAENKYYSINLMQDKVNYYGNTKLLMDQLDSLAKISSKKNN